MNGRTKKVTLTGEGHTRKLHRLISLLLSQQQPALHSQLEAEALLIIAADNQDPFSEVFTVGLGVVHKKRPSTIEAEKKQRRARARKLKEIGL